MKLEYSTIVDCGGETRYWDGDPDDAIAAAANYLGAVRTERGHIYLASETDEAFRLTRDEMIEAGAAILGGAGDWYSLWCSHTGRELTRRTRDRYFGKSRMKNPAAVSL